MTNNSSHTITKKVNGLMAILIAFLLGTLAYGATPNPGHPWIQVGDGTWAASGTTAYRTFTFPDATATIMTTLDIQQGDLLYGSAASTTTRLPKDTNATRYLSNTGASNNPAWAQISLSNGVTGVLDDTNGGTSANLTPSNGGILYSTAVGMAILAGNGTAGKLLQSGASADPSWSTATYPSTGASSGYVLVSNGTNWIADIATTTTVSTKDINSTTLGTVLTNAFTSSTTFKVGIFNIPEQITANMISASIGTVTTATGLKLCVYDESGSKVIDATTANPTANQTVSTTSFQSTTLLPGNYYFAVGCLGNCNLQLKTWGKTAAGPFTTLQPTGKKIYEGRVVMTTPGTCNTTLPAITAEASTTPIGRIDN